MDSTAEPRRHLPLLTNSRRAAFQLCPNFHDLVYNRGYRSVREDEARDFGTLGHVGLEWWWGHQLPEVSPGVRAMILQTPDDRAQHLLDRMRDIGMGIDARPVAPGTVEFQIPDPIHAALLGMLNYGTGKPVDPYVMAAAQVMLGGYSMHWRDAGLQPVRVEWSGTAPLVNPDTSRESTTWQQAGKLDVLAIDDHTRRMVIVEHKFTALDIAPGTEYWRKLRMDPQVSTYFDLSAAAGADPSECLYDAVRRPWLKPSKVPLVDGEGVKIVLDGAGARVRTKDGKKWRETADTAQGWVLQTRAQTVAEFTADLKADVVARPDYYLQRQVIVRLDGELNDHRRDAWMIARMMRDAQLSGRHPRNPSGCSTWGKLCEFFDVCTGVASLDDRTRFVQSDILHPELPAHLQGAGATPDTE